MAETADYLVERVRINTARRAELAAAIDQDIAELVETHRFSTRRLAKELHLGSDNSVRLAVSRYHRRQRERRMPPPTTESQ